MLSRISVLVALSVLFSSAAFAQAVGVEFEFNEVLASGPFNTCACGAAFDGPGTDWNLGGALLVEMPIAHESFLTFSFGNRRLSAQYSENVTDTAVIEGPPDDTVTDLHMKNVGSWSADYLQVSTTIGTRVLFGLEAYLGLGVQLLQGSRQRFERQLVASPVPIRFSSSGTTSETVIDGELTSDNIHQFHSIGLVGLQYRWKEWAPIVLIPKIQADLELSPVFQSKNGGVKTSNVLASVAALYAF